ncbi:uncharacterized protein J7T54_003640 [Emericellopsis cladophorae]|uniref:Uncharacterized protein n=1 Tax=Emericellopsis cladophorae TaxID=2686198 RepID=A0A9Q0BE73_9HYPO|nr:uncharacterized protein J7T54_003640 [Emericellopsis cladophorae]KAI6782627.1 hypothetical protein J7T54_003640 [Emericellopsis cladophorae]
MAPTTDRQLEVANPQAQEPIQMTQPSSQQAMDPQQAHPHTEEPEMNLRGGEDCGGWCRGRFCFIPFYIGLPQPGPNLGFAEAQGVATAANIKARYLIPPFDRKRVFGTENDIRSTGRL